MATTTENTPTRGPLKRLRDFQAGTGVYSAAARAARGKRFEPKLPACGRCKRLPCVADNHGRNLEPFYRQHYLIETGGPANGHRAWSELAKSVRAAWRCKAERIRRGLPV